ncbi:MAG: NADH-quinone oxidoreductase subunit J [Candidatus Bathyarchaeia archaeon]
MILEILSIGIIISACFALFLDEVVYSVAAFAVTFMFTALLYWVNGSTYAAIFQFAVGVGTLAILFLSGEMLGDKGVKKTSPEKLAALLGIGVVLSLPALFISVSGSGGSYGVSTASFGDSLWNLNGLDVVLQALVLLTVALGIAIILYERKKGAL